MTRKRSLSLWLLRFSPDARRARRQVDMSRYHDAIRAEKMRLVQAFLTKRAEMKRGEA